MIGVNLKTSKRNACVRKQLQMLPTWICIECAYASELAEASHVMNIQTWISRDTHEQVDLGQQLHRSSQA